MSHGTILIWPDAPANPGIWLFETRDRQPEANFGEIELRRRPGPSRSANVLRSALERPAVYDAIAWRDAFVGIRVRCGIYRFRTHEEVDDFVDAGPEGAQQ